MDQDFERELLAAFAEEAADHVRGLTAGLLDLENGVTQGEGEPLVASVYRKAHSLKGAARAVGLAEVEQVCHALESVLGAMKSAQVLASPQLFDELQAAVQVVDEWLQSGRGEPAKAEAVSARLLHLLVGAQKPSRASQALPALAPRALARPPSHALSAAPLQSPLGPRPGAGAMATAPTDPAGLPALSPAPTAAPAHSPPSPAAASPNPAPQQAAAPALGAPAKPGKEADAPREAEPVKSSFSQTGNTGAYSGDATVRIQVRKLEAIFAQSEELMALAFAQRRRLSEVRALVQRLAGWRKALEDEELTREAPPLGDQVGGMVRSLLSEARALESSLAIDCAALDRQVADLVGAARAGLLQPFSGLFEPCQKIVRDLAREQGKSIELIVEGADLSVDRRILEALRDPLMHLLRNACDHGVEPPPQRREAGKPDKAQVRLQAVPMGTDHVELRVSDDGAGMQPQRLRDKAVALGMHSAEEMARWTDEAVLELAFAAELSTAKSVTPLSGRGLGLAIVRQAIEDMGGSVSVHSQPGLGTQFLLRLPVSLSTFRGVLVSSQGQVFAIPSHQVERVVPYRPDEQGTVAGLPMVGVGGVQLPAPRLADLLALPAKSPRAPSETAVVVAASGRRAALRVDAVLAEEEGLAKGLGKQLRRVRGISGIANFAEHSLIPLIHLADLLGAPVVTQVDAESSAAASSSSGGPRPHQPTVCIAEDSATARQLMVHVLRNAGYHLRIAENGAEALNLLRSEPCDALISDVEMPVLDGFGLTEAVRADAHLHDLPVILVTSLESREYREKGAAVGANAYVIKRNFEPAGLLAALERLV